MRISITLIALMFCASSFAVDTEDGLLELDAKPDTGQVLLQLNALPVEFLYAPALKSPIRVKKKSLSI